MLHKHTSKGLSKAFALLSYGDSSTGTVLLETALGLPIFLIMFFGIWEVSTLLRERTAVSRALTMACQSFQAVSATENISEEILFERASRTFDTEVLRLQLSRNSVEIGRYGSEETPFILVGRPFSLDELLSSDYDTPKAYELRAVYRLISPFSFALKNFAQTQMSTVCLFEAYNTGTPSTSGSSTSDTVLAFFPEQTDPEKQIQRISKEYAGL